MLALIRSPFPGWFALALALVVPGTSPDSASALLADLVPPTARRDAPSSPEGLGSPGDPSTPDDALARALELERTRNWPAAITLYEQALERWPSRTELRHRLRLCETHYRLGRRYEDRSFREVLLRLPREDALALFDELIDRIETGYVDPVRLEPLLRHGFDNLEVALRDPAFLDAHGADSPDRADRVRWLRDAFRSQRGRMSARTKGEARAQVEVCCDLGRRALGLADAAVILEFVYGACDALDEYSGCLSPDKLSDLYAEIDGNFVGIGVELKGSDRGLLLVNVIPGGPASESGLKPGEQIVEVDGRPLAGLGLDAAAATLQGAEHSEVTVRVLGAGGQARSVRMARRPVELKSVESSAMLQGGIGFIRLVSFQKTTVEEMDRAVADLQARGMRHMVLDLRGNPGGLLNVSVDLADRFLDRGRIVATRGRAPGQTFDYTASGAAPWRMPVTVLIDGDSASASEILAGALKDHRRALIVGGRSYGKGSVQSIYPLRSADAALKLTTAKFYSPLERPYSEHGVSPDIEVSSSARPPGDDPGLAPVPIPYGDPEKDPALRVAIRRALEGDLAGAGG
ncbi:S41 family peptidase [Tautonia plasticadhaerens]|uniref:Putative CtpA-like serine protease n=1 Tax=Tautonia plasticadhaerens TaxID=2527974 RepID=A0A518H596_9BACT|nr:S41 family peptidase [Tautonia plasticadhaerens]QDV36014.1 putative CtpA-like serine protease [Tautonia plasticadhaerens]